MKRITTLLLLSLTVFSGWCFGQKTGEQPCMELLKEVYQNLSEASGQTQGKIFYMDYVIKTVMNDDAGSQVPSVVKLYSSIEKSYLISDEIKVFQDQRSSVSVIAANKVIYVNDYAGDQVKKDKLSSLAFIQDTLFTLSQVTFCENVQYDGITGYKKIRMELNDTGRKLFRTNALTFYIDPARNYIKKVEIEYISTHELAGMEVIFNTLSYDYDTELLAGPATSMIFQENGMLLPAYSGYRLIDTRKN